MLITCVNESVCVWVTKEEEIAIHETHTNKVSHENDKSKPYIHIKNPKETKKTKIDSKS